jgi:hypothetical protein
VAERPDEQLAPNRPILSALPLYMAMRLSMDALRASTIFLPARQIIIAAMLAAIKPTTVCNGRLKWLWAARSRNGFRRADRAKLVLPVRIELTTSPLPSAHSACFSCSLDYKPRR